MTRSARIFIALAVPEDRAEKLQRLQTLIAPELPGARWVEPGKFHVTLAFLGEVADTDLNALCLAVAVASKPFRPLGLALQGLGVFPDPQRPRAVWVGLTGPGVEELIALQEAVASAATGAGYALEDDRFHPHVTLGRLKPRRDSSGDCSPLLRHYERWMGGSFDVSEVLTYASTITPEGPIYLALNRAPLRGRG